ncbi:acyltransferase domain-containing protein [Kribbella swartbergensis]
MLRERLIAPLELPSHAAAEEDLRRLGVDAADRAATLEARPDPHRHPELWSLLERCHHQLTSTVGTTGPLTPWPALPALGALGRHAYVLVLFGAITTVAVVSLFPMALLFLAFQRYFVRGVLAGALKA